MKVLILRFSSIGDIVLTSPVVRTVKTQLPQVELHYATKASYKAIFEANPYIDKLHLLENNLSDLVRRLKAEKFDYVIDLHHNLRTLLIKTKLGVKSSAFNKLNWEKLLYVNLKINRLPNVHIVERYLKAAEPLGIKDDGKGLDYFIPSKDEVETDWLPSTMQKGYVVFAIGGQHGTKKLPLEKMIELCDRINKPIILLGGKEDAAVGDAIVAFFEKKEENASYEKGLKEMGKKAIVFNGCGKFNLNQSADVVRKSTVVFTHDTGLMHIAAAFQKQIYSIWGNTSPHFGMYPYRTPFVIFENNQLDCRPCSKIGFDSCPKGHFKCMKDLTFDFYLP